MTIERDDEIVKRVKAGEPYASIGQSFGITGERVRQIAGYAGVSSINNHLYLPAPDETQQLLALYERGMPIKHIAGTLGRDERNVWNWLVRNGYHVPTDNREDWSDHEDMRLRQEYGAWGAAGRLARELGRTRNEIIGRAYRLGLSRRTKPQSKRAA